MSKRIRGKKRWKEKHREGTSVREGERHCKNSDCSVNLIRSVKGRDGEEVMVLK